jgi:large conductance mechanosensitive channel
MHPISQRAIEEPHLISVQSGESRRKVDGMKILHEFRQFIQRGNVVDLAVGVIMGAAFGKIVNSLVADVLMPPIGYVIGGVKFTELKVTLPASAIAEKSATINYGQFLQNTFDFLLTAGCIFLIVKGINTLHRKFEAEPAPKEAPPPTPTEKLLIEIRDLLQQLQKSGSPLPANGPDQSAPH